MPNNWFNNFLGTWITSNSASTPDVPFRLQVGIDGHAYLIDVKQYRRRTIAAIREPQDGSVEPGEQTLNAEGIWRRSQENWVLGAGQEFFDNRISQVGLFSRNGENASIRYRFFKSRGVNVWTEGKLTLLHEVEQKLSSAATSIQVLTVGSNLYYMDGANVKFTADPTPAAGGIAWTTVALGGKTPVWMASDGSTVFIACTDSVRSSANGSATSANVVALGAPPQKIAYCNGRLIVAVANQLSEVTRTPALVGIGAPSNNNPSFVFTDIIGAPNAIYACGAAGNHGEVYGIGVDPSTGALTTPVHATGLPFGETPNALAFYGGLVLMATTVGFRESVINSVDNKTLQFGPVIDGFGATQCIDCFGEFAWFGISNYTTANPTSPSTTLTTSGLARVDLARNIADMIPAYNADVQATVAGTVMSVCNLGGRRYFAIVGQGIFGENAHYQDAGMVQSGLIRYGTVEPKIVVGADWRHDPLPAGSSAGMYVIKESGATISVGPTILTGSVGPNSPQDTSESVGESFQVQVYITRSGDTNSTPTLRRWTVRALVTPQRIDEILVPLIIRTRDEVPVGEGQYTYCDPLTEFNFLKTLERSGEVINYQEGNSVFRAYIDRIEIQPDKWKDDRSFFEGTILVRLITIPEG